MMAIPNRVRVVAVMLALALAGGLLTLTLLAKPSQAQPSTPNENRGATSQEMPLAGGIDTIECGGEQIDLTGTLHILTHFFADEEGGYHLNSHYNVQDGEGVGRTTGEMYRFASSGANVENYIPPQRADQHRQCGHERRHREGAGGRLVEFHTDPLHHNHRGGGKGGNRGVSFWVQVRAC
jgi:hypothetical protein